MAVAAVVALALLLMPTTTATAMPGPPPVPGPLDGPNPPRGAVGHREPFTTFMGSGFIQYTAKYPDKVDESDVLGVCGVGNMNAVPCGVVYTVERGNELSADAGVDVKAVSLSVGYKYTETTTIQVTCPQDHPLADGQMMTAYPYYTRYEFRLIFTDVLAGMIGPVPQYVKISKPQAGRPMSLTTYLPGVHCKPHFPAATEVLPSPTRSTPRPMPQPPKQTPPPQSPSTQVSPKRADPLTDEHHRNATGRAAGAQG